MVDYPVVTMLLKILGIITMDPFTNLCYGDFQ